MVNDLTRTLPRLRLLMELAERGEIMVKLTPVIRKLRADRLVETDPASDKHTPRIRISEAGIAALESAEYGLRFFGRLK